MSKTDKTRPWKIKVEEARRADPYSSQQTHYSPGDHYPYAPGVWGCPTSCYSCRGWMKYENRKTRREGRKQCRDYDLD